jgi:aldehyde dehydrogenase (NAD+)
MTRRFGQFINGGWVDSESTDTFDSSNPATGELVATFPRGSRGDVVRAIEAAEAAFPKWKATPAPERGQILFRAAQIMRQRKQELGEVVSTEMGKVIAEGLGDVQESIDFLEYMAGEGRRLLGETTTSELRQKFAMWVRQPIGVVGAITPWNFPTAIPVWKIAAALISGNTMVFKPATYTPMAVAMVVEVLADAGLPPGVLNVVFGPGSTVGDEIVENPRIKHVSFTGGVPTGVEILVRAAKHLKSVELELGGKNPAIVMPDANIDLVVEGTAFGAFGTPSGWETPLTPVSTWAPWPARPRNGRCWITSTSGRRRGPDWSAVARRSPAASSTMASSSSPPSSRPSMACVSPKRRYSGPFLPS